jgi:hypothetical protein
MYLELIPDFDKNSIDDHNLDGMRANIIQSDRTGIVLQGCMLDCYHDHK